MVGETADERTFGEPIREALHDASRQHPIVGLAGRPQPAHRFGQSSNFVQKARLADTQVVDRRLEEIFPPFFYQHMSLKSKVEEVFRTGHSITGEHMVYRVPGVPQRFYYYSLLPFRWKDEMENVMLLMEDVTDVSGSARKRGGPSAISPASWKVPSDLVVSTDLKGRIVSWNTAAARATGYEETEVRAPAHLVALLRVEPE